MYFPFSPPAQIMKLADAAHTGVSRSTNAISEIILHATAGGFQGSLDWLTWQSSGNGTVSVHILIDKDGTIYRLVPDDRVAYHVGFSSIGSRKNLNASSLGVELVNKNDGRDPLRSWRVRAWFCIGKVCMAICRC
jgi:N-acetyl-anhydromuramyl-L-alanine amidase AmpD